MMEIQFKNTKLKKIFEDNKKLKQKYGNQSEKIIQRMFELSSAKNLYDISKLPQANLHLLKQNWQGHFSVDLIYPYRLILLPLNGNKSNLKSITIIKIIIIINYHSRYAFKK